MNLRHLSRHLVLTFAFLALLGICANLPSQTNTQTDYDRALAEAIKIFPPGDYDYPIPWPVSTRPPVAPNGDLLIKEIQDSVDPPNTDDIPLLFQQAATFFLDGRWDLAKVRYKQILLLEPSNIEAKAHLYDYLELMALPQNGRLFRKKYRDFTARLTKEAARSSSPTK